MSTPEGERIAALETEVRHLTKLFDEWRERSDKQQAELYSQVCELNRHLSEAKGGWKTLVIIGTIASSAGALIAKFVPFFNNG